ncbi:MAG: hypothetical protein WCB96_08920 [Candidatus Aminicenantales bacterium]
MKKLSVFLLAGLLLAGTAFAGVVKKSKSEISFKKFGTFSTVMTEKISADRMARESENNFKGKGLVGSLAGKALLRSGQFGEIIDLPQMTITSLDFKRKEYQVRPIQPLPQQTGKEAAGQQAAQEKPEDKDVKIIRSEFKVTKAGESKTINQFPCDKYTIASLVEWENAKTKEKGAERLNTEVWTTALNADLKTGREEEFAFGRDYFKKLGLNSDPEQQEFLGANWLTILSSLDVTGRRPRLSAANTSAELKKIQGYPVVVDGKYFTTVEGGEQPAQEAGSSGGLLGKLAKGVLDRKSKDDSTEPDLSFYTELLEVNRTDLSPTDFQAPSNFKEKK